MTDLVVAGSFQDKIFAKIKESIGDLMTDDDLKRLVEAAMKDAFFKDRVTNTGGQWGRSETQPPLLVETVQKLLQSRVDEAIGRWLTEHHDEVLKLINDRITAGATQFIATAFDMKMQYAFQQFGDQLRQAMVNR